MYLLAKYKLSYVILLKKYYIISFLIFIIINFFNTKIFYYYSFDLNTSCVKVNLQTELQESLHKDKESSPPNLQQMQIYKHPIP